MDQPGGSLDLALKSESPATASAFCAAEGDMTFKSDEAIHVPVPGFIYLAHATGAEPVEHDVIAEHEAARAALKQQLRLEPGEVAVIDQRPGQHGCVGGGCDSGRRFDR